MCIKFLDYVITWSITSLYPINSFLQLSNTKNKIKLEIYDSLKKAINSHHFLFGLSNKILKVENLYVGVEFLSTQIIFENSVKTSFSIRKLLSIMCVRRVGNVTEYFLFEIQAVIRLLKVPNLCTKYYFYVKLIDSILFC